MKFFTNEVKIALVAIAGVVILFFGINFLKGKNLFANANTYYITFDNIMGLGASTPIYADGFKVGTVKNIVFDYGELGPIKIEIELNQAMRVPVGTTAEIDKDLMVFSPQINLISDDFDGLGVEWGAYEDLNKLQTNAWDRITKYADRMDGMSLIRCMINFDWFCENFDNKGDTDKTNDTWTYNFTNKWMKSTEQVLTYCQEHDLTVAFGAWNVIGNLANDKWGM